MSGLSDDYQIIIDKSALNEIKSKMTNDITLASLISVNKIDYKTYQLLLTLRGLEEFLKKHRIKPTFKVDLTDYCEEDPSKRSSSL